MKKLTVGVIGLGILGSQHAQFLQDQPELEVVAVTDVISSRAQAVATQVTAQAYTDYTNMLREHTLDIAVVATPDPMHKEPVLAARRSDGRFIALPFRSETRLAGKDRPAGAWRASWSDAGPTVVNEFDPGAVEACYLYVGSEFFNLELFTVKRDLGPGESLRLQHAYVVEPTE